MSFIHLTGVMGNNETEKDNLKKTSHGSWFTGPVYDDTKSVDETLSRLLLRNFH